MFDRFQALTTRQQLVLVAMAAFACALLIGALWLAFFRVDYRPLFTELRPADAATIVADLDRKKIDYRLEQGGTTILVPVDLVDSTRLNLMTDDLPLKGTVGFELFNKSDMGLTDFAQKINYQRALQGELERTIMTLDGVESARVHLSMGEERIFRDDRVPPKASVTVRMRRGASLTDDAAQGVQRLIAAAVPNLDVSGVVILDEAGRVIGAPAHVEPLPGTGSPEAEEKTAIEQYYRALIRQALDHAYPQLGMSVAVVAGTSGVDPNGALPDWNPAARSFPLMITLTSATTIDAASQEGVRSFVGGIVRSTATTSDAIQFAVELVPPAKAEPATAPLPSVAERGPTVPAAEETERGEWMAVAALFAAMLLVLIGGVAFLFRRREPKRLSERQRAEFSTRLRTAFAPGDGHG
ncbi:MAG TPA: flagellar basal-body MS-ring/collar protein FliF [Rhizomicrobium sp.]|nr:flagellar basal-body MS-ring/collar protein FliF [Rhizomicrobium sp.]